MISLLSLVIDALIRLYIYCIIGYTIFHWLFVLQILTVANQRFCFLYDLLTRLTSPLLDPLRRLLPNLGGIDLSPLVAILGLLLLRPLILF